MIFISSECFRTPPHRFLAGGCPIAWPARCQPRCLITRFHIASLHRGLVASLCGPIVASFVLLLLSFPHRLVTPLPYGSFLHSVIAPSFISPLHRSPLDSTSVASTFRGVMPLLPARLDIEKSRRPEGTPLSAYVRHDGRSLAGWTAGTRVKNNLSFGGVPLCSSPSGPPPWDLHRFWHLHGSPGLRRRGSRS